jgi:hypothetical protein
MQRDGPHPPFLASNAPDLLYRHGGFGRTVSSPPQAVCERVYCMGIDHFIFPLDRPLLGDRLSARQKKAANPLQTSEVLRNPGGFIFTGKIFSLDVYSNHHY